MDLGSQGTVQPAGYRVRVHRTMRIGMVAAGLLLTGCSVQPGPQAPGAPGEVRTTVGMSSTADSSAEQPAGVSLGSPPVSSHRPTDQTDDFDDIPALKSTPAPPEGKVRLSVRIVDSASGMPHARQTYEVLNKDGSRRVSTDVAYITDNDGWGGAVVTPGVYLLQTFDKAGTAVTKEFDVSKKTGIQSFEMLIP